MRRALPSGRDGTPLDTDHLRRCGFAGNLGERGRGRVPEERPTRSIGYPDGAIPGRFRPGEAEAQERVLARGEARVRAGPAGPLTEPAIGAGCPARRPAPAPRHGAIRPSGGPLRRRAASGELPSGLAAARASGAFTSGMKGALRPCRLRAARTRAAIRDVTDPGLHARLATL